MAAAGTHPFSSWIDQVISPGERYENIVEELHATVSADLSIFVRNTNGVNCALVWPAYGAQHGFFFRTNAYNPVLAWAAVTNGKSAMISMTCWGTNVFATITEWP